jgi:hypothetical protein
MLQTRHCARADCGKEFTEEGSFTRAQVEYVGWLFVGPKNKPEAVKEYEKLASLDSGPLEPSASKRPRKEESKPE